MRTLFLSLLMGIFLLSGCGEDTSTHVNVQAPYQAGAYVVFDSQNGDIPYPNNILFADSNDTTLNIPFHADDSDAVVKQALNQLDGFSTTSPISVSFSGDINASTLINGLKLYEVSATTALPQTKGVPYVTSVTKTLTFGVDYVATVSGNKIVILPLQPLQSNQNYMVVLTKDITDNSGHALAADVASELLLQTTPLVDATGNHTSLSIEDATKLEGVRQLTQAMITLATQQGLNRDDIISAWSFKTQTIGAVAQAFVDANKSGILGVQDTNLTSQQMLALAGIDTSAMHGNAEIYVGTLAGIPYYLAKASSQYDTAPLTQAFEFNTTITAMPELNATVTIPALVSIPKGQTMPSSGWPIVIFQHGITQNRTNLLAISEAFASAGYAAVAIDLPLHGVDDNTSPLYMGTLERTFNLDLINNSTNEAGPDGKIDPSGIHYINLASLLTSRDNVRQTTSDLVALKNALASATVIDANGSTKFDASRVAFVGHSLGTIAPFGFLEHAHLESVTLAMPGGGIAQLLNNSATFGPIIESGLASEGVMKGSAAYDAFMLATQTVLDDADPLNYAKNVGVKQKIFAIEVVGDTQLGHASDLVIPNNVSTAPLAGTDPLVKLLQATTLSADAAPNKTARYISGHHSSILRPNQNADEAPTPTEMSVLQMMQTQVATFVGSQGTQIPVVDVNLLNTSY